MIRNTLVSIICVLCLLPNGLLTGQVLTLDHGKISFHTTSIMSDIEAVSTDAVVSIDMETRMVEITVPIASFEFEYEMMQEHFNEEYLESEKFPNATFQGLIAQDISTIVAPTDVDVSGQLTIHGVTKEVQFKATVSKKEC